MRIQNVAILIENIFNAYEVINWHKLFYCAEMDMLIKKNYNLSKNM